MENRQRVVSENGTDSERGGYMRQAAKHMGGVLQAVLLWGMGIQILLGLAWLIRNMAGLQYFQESSLLLAGESAADGFYSGILYRGLAALLSSRPWILYGIQLAAAIIAGYGLMSCLIGRNRVGLKLFCALALTSIPQAMQCHLAVLPWSLGTSLLLGETALWMRAWKRIPMQNGQQTLGEPAAQDGQGAWEEPAAQGIGQDADRKAQGKLAAAMLSGWVLIVLVLPIYAWFALPMLFAMLWRMGRSRKGLRKLVWAWRHWRCFCVVSQ